MARHGEATPQQIAEGLFKQLGRRAAFDAAGGGMRAYAAFPEPRKMWADVAAHLRVLAEREWDEQHRDVKPWGREVIYRGFHLWREYGVASDPNFGGGKWHWQYDGADGAPDAGRQMVGCAQTLDECVEAIDDEIAEEFM